MMTPTKLLRSVLFALALVFLAPLAGAGLGVFPVEAAQAATVAKISVSGNSQVDVSAIKKYLALNVGDTATSAKLNASVEALQATGLFKTVSVTMQGSTLVVKVSENPLVASVQFEGNQRFSDDNLVAMIDLMNRGTVDQGGIDRDVATITRAYRDAGYQNATVTTRLEKVADGRERVVFVINEQTRTGIAAINFTGNNSISAWTLKSIIRTHESGWLSWLLKDDSYTQEQLDTDRQIIQAYYANHGYPDAQVTSAVAEYNAERNGYFINFTIIEGDYYKFGAVGVETSINGLDANTLTGLIRTRQGDRFSAAEMNRSAQDMSVEATNLGYPFAEVRPRVERDPSTGAFSVTYLVDEGQHLYVERVNITGNAKTRDYVIRRELGFAEGDPFNRALVSRAKGNIEALGFFSQVSINAEQGSAPDKVVLNIAVTEQGTGDYGITAGYDTKSGVLGELSLTERNFLGRGQSLKASIGASQGGRSVDFSFTEPYFMGLKMSAGIDLYSRVTDETSDNIYGRTATGGQLRFGLPVTRDVSLSLMVGADQTTIADATGPTSKIFKDKDAFTKAWLGYTATYNTLDDQKHPTEGIVASLSQQYVGVDYNFMKTEAKLRWYMPILPDARVVGSIKLQGGILNDFSGKGINPLETFDYGSQLVRGFLPGNMGPAVDNAPGYEYLGYTAYAGASVEASFPIPMLPDTYGLSGAIWADAAYVQGNGDPAGNSVAAASIDKNLKASAGASVIWESPFGPLRGDTGFILSGASADKHAWQPCAGLSCPFFQLTLDNKF